MKFIRVKTGICLGMLMLSFASCKKENDENNTAVDNPAEKAGDTVSANEKGTTLREVQSADDNDIKEHLDSIKNLPQ